MMLEQVVHSVQEPTIENRLEVEGKVAIYKDMQNMRFKNRFGEEIVRKRRRYAIEGEATGYYPLDEKLGLEKYGGFSPLMTYLLTFFGGCEAYGTAARMVSMSCQKQSRFRNIPLPDVIFHPHGRSGAATSRPSANTTSASGLSAPDLGFRF